MTLLIVGIYFFILLLVSVFSYRKGFRNIFSTGKRLPWLLAGFSVFVINPGTINILSKMGIVATEGYSGMWIFYTGMLGAGFLPVIFAPLWSRLRFMTDNQFILLRFSGASARILHLFRAVYVGYLVVALFIAQVFTGLTKLLIVFFGVSYIQAFLLIGGGMILLVFKNSLRLKIRTDFLNGILYILAFAAGAYFVVRQYGGTTHMYAELNAHYRDYIRLFPSSVEQSTFGTVPTLLVYFLVQWWSIDVLDGAGPEAQRFMNIRNPNQAFKAAFLPMVLFSLVFLFHSFVIDAGILMFNQEAFQVPLINGAPDPEAAFISMYKMAMPGGLSGVIFIAFLTGFVSFIESFINWGSGYIVVDVFKTYVFPGRPEKFFSRLSYAVMLLIGFTGLLVAWYNSYLLGLQKFIFAMGAGVGPVFILRWFWWRINAWSQFTAMLSSLLYAVGWDLLYKYTSFFHEFVSQQQVSLNMNYYAFKLVCLTLLVTATWLLVTFLTRPDDAETIRKFVEKVKPGGVWPGIETAKQTFKPVKLLLLVVYAVVSVLPFLFIWEFKFGSQALASAMAISWIVLMIFVVRRMGRTDK